MILIPESVTETATHAFIDEGLRRLINGGKQNGLFYGSIYS